MLDLHRSRQQDVGVARGVGHEVIDDHGEQIVARQAAPHPGLVRDAGRRVRGQTKSACTGGSSALEQALAEPGHVAAPAPDAGAKVVAPQRRPVDAEEPARVVVDAAAGMAPVAGDARGCR